MFRRKIKTMVAIAVFLGLAAAPVIASATSSSANQDLLRQIANLKKQVTQLQKNQQQTQSWLNQRKKAEVKNLVREVMQDASSRSSMLQENSTAGISEDGNIFLRSADGSFSFNPFGLVKVQYIYNNIPTGGAAGANETPGGFQLGLARFGANGYIGNPHIGYHFELSFAANGLYDTTFDEYTIFYKFDNGLKLTAGRFKQPFSRSRLINDGHQLAVDRSPVAKLLATGRSQGAMLSYKTNKLYIRAALNDGGNLNNPYSAYNNTPADFSVVARADYKVSGDWSQLDDSFNSWTGTGKAIFIGAAIDYESGNTEDNSYSYPSYINNIIMYTVDASLQSNGLSLYVAGFGDHIEHNSGFTADNFGVIAQAAYFVVPDKVQPFIRYSGLFFDNSSRALIGMDRTLNTLTAGINWYQHRQNAKFTIDGVYVFNKCSFLGSVSHTLSDTTEAGEIAIRAQYQLMF